MSWREILGATSSPNISFSPQNSHNDQNSAYPGNCANNANIACGKSDERKQMKEALANARENPTVTLHEIEAAITTADEVSLKKGAIGDATLKAFTESLGERLEMNRGVRPNLFNQSVSCRHCGPIWLWLGGNVPGCPWFWNRCSGKPIPRPDNVRCQDCSYFKRTAHRHLGHCHARQPEPPAGLWGEDERMCLFFLPNNTQ